MTDHFLDVEDDDQRQNRLGALLGRLSDSSTSTMVNPNPLLNIGHESQPGPIEPPTELLARVQAFLPVISASNKQLSQMEPDDIDIENIKEDEEQYIEMNLGLGVLEAKPLPKPGSRPSFEVDPSSDATSSESESESDSPRPSSEEESESDSSSSSSEYDSDSESLSGSSVDMKPVFSRFIKPLPRRVSQQTKV